MCYHWVSNSCHDDSPRTFKNQNQKKSLNMIKIMINDGFYWFVKSWFMICNKSSVSYFVVRVQPSSLYTIDSLGPAGAWNSLSGWSLWFLLFYYYYFIYFILLSNYLLFIYCFIIGKNWKFGLAENRFVGIWWFA